MSFTWVQGQKKKKVNILQTSVYALLLIYTQVDGKTPTIFFSAQNGI